MNINTSNLSRAIESKIDKSKWVKWRFSDLVENIVEKVVPKECGLEDYIGLKHLDTGSLKIHRYGKCSEISGDKLKIYEGDLIFAKRNSYLKRVAIADFDAVASAHSLVLRAKSENINPEFLPFFLMSETFWTRAIEISVGSLSPTINWRVLAKQEFHLPPKELQPEIAALFWAIDSLIEKSKTLKASLTIAKKSSFRRFIADVEYQQLSIVADVMYGLGQPPEKDENGVAVIRATDIKRGHISEDNFLRVKHSAIPKGKNVDLKSGDLIIVRSGAYTGDLAKIPDHLEGAIGGYDLIIRPNRNIINSTFLAEYLLDDIAQSYFKGKSIRSAQPHLNSKQVLATRIPKLDISEQNEIAKTLDRFENLIKCYDENIKSGMRLRKSLINKVF